MSDDSMVQNPQIRDFVRSCWYSPGELRGWSVTIVMQMNPDKTLKSAEIDPPDRARMDDPGYREFAQSALRAVQKCGAEGQKFPISDDLPYSEWSVIKARFRDA